MCGKPACIEKRKQLLQAQQSGAVLRKPGTPSYKGKLIKMVKPDGSEVFYDIKYIDYVMKEVEANGGSWEHV